MGEQNNNQEISLHEVELIRELAQLRKNRSEELEYESLDGYEMPPRTQFSMIKKPAVSIKYGQMLFNTACIRLFEGIKFIIPTVNTAKKRMAIIMCPEEDEASVQWARQKNGKWINKSVSSPDFTEKIFQLMGWNRECRYKVLGRVSNSSEGIIMLFDLEEAIMFTPPQEYQDPDTGEIRKRQTKYYPDYYKNHIGRSYSDYAASRQMSMFENLIGYQSEVPDSKIENSEEAQLEQVNVDNTQDAADNGISGGAEWKKEE